MCTKCKKEEAEWDNLCQDCWEAWTSRLWWASHGGVFETEEYRKLIEVE